MASRPKRNLLTDAELELMLILWQLGEASVREVLAALPPGRSMAYTTASTIIRILEKKNYVDSRKVGKAHVYTPCMSKEEYEGLTIGHVVGQLFDRSPASLVARLIDDERLSAQELAEIRQLLESKGGHGTE